MNETNSTAEPGWGVPLSWIIAAVLVTLLAGIGIGLAVANSEEAGMTATMIAALPLGLAWSGALASLVIKFTPWHRTLARILAPIGCALVGGVLLIALAAVFFLAIFPSL